MDREIVSHFLNEWIIQNVSSQEALARKAGVSRLTVCRICNAHTTVKWDVIEKVLNAIECELRITIEERITA